MVQAVSEEWMEQVLAEHRYLREAVDETQEFLDSPRPSVGEKGSHTWAVELSQRLVHLHDELFRHFRFEEQAGVIEDLTVHHPEAARELSIVLGEHPEMLREIRQITSDVLAYSDGEKPENPRLRRRVGTLLETLRKHEHHETHLIQRLEYRDIGVAD